MEPNIEHPVPQNVTSFQFHLVGDMTIKQFGYLAGGFVTAYLTYLLIFPISAIIAIPIILFSIAAGFCLAFVPILDRPLDHWVKAFFKAVYSPTEGYWTSPVHPREKVNPNDHLFTNRLLIYLTQQTIPVINTPRQAAPTAPPVVSPTPTVTTAPIPVPARPLTKPMPQPPISPKPASSLPPAPPLPHPQPPATPAIHPLKPKLPTPEELTKLVEMAQQIQLLRDRINETEKEISELKLAATSTTTHLYEKQSAQAFENLQSLLKQTEDVYQKSGQINNNSSTPQLPPRTVVVAPPKTVEKQILLTSSPNIINGVVVDKTGNYLEGVIAIIHNKDQMPVRALKTNKLGQFSGATPLPNGTYTVTLEKEGLSFDTFQVTLSGEVMPPVRAIEKGEVR